MSERRRRPPRDPDPVQAFFDTLDKAPSVRRKGGLTFVEGLEGLSQVGKAVRKVNLEADGQPLTPDLESALERERRAATTEWANTFAAMEVPENLKALLAARKKKHAERIADEITITSSDLFALIMRHADDGWTYRSMHRDFVPEEARLTSEDEAAFFGNGVGRFSPRAQVGFNKIKALFTKRLHRSAHLFQRGTEWHSFYMTYADIGEADRRNHWEGGSHIHYVSHLWPRVDRDTLWRSLEHRELHVPSVHIRYVHE